MINEEHLIPELADWKKANSNRFSINDWTSIEGNIKLAIGYSFLFWPEFTEHDHCIFLKSHFSADTFDHWNHPDHSSNYAEIESIMNHIHIVDLFATVASRPQTGFFLRLFNKASREHHNTITKEQVIFLGNRLLEIYRAKLSIDFPGKSFELFFDSAGDPENLEDYQLSFCQTANKTRKTKHGAQ